MEVPERPRLKIAAENFPLGLLTLPESTGVGQAVFQKSERRATFIVN
jgi:hypothetical protein